jgi:hypothetical protein
MSKHLFVFLAFIIVVGLTIQSASAQLPDGLRIPKPSKPKPIPTPAAQPQPTHAAEPQQAAQPQAEDRAASGAAPQSGGPYARRFDGTETPMLLPETLEVRTELQDGKWYPDTKFQVAYTGETRLRYKAEYTLPTGAPWYTETLELKGGAPFYTMESEYDSEKAAKAVPTEGLFGLKVTNMRDNSTAFQGKFRITKFKQENASGPKDVDYAVDHDWALPIGYTNISWDVDEGTSDKGDPGIRMWFKGGFKTDDLEARLFHNGKQIATTDEGGSVGGGGDRRFPKYGGNNPALMWELLEFRWPRKLLFASSEQGARYAAESDMLILNQMPGEYTVKVYYQGEQVRETKFKIADGNFADVGVSLPNGLKTYRVILPVRVMGTTDKWNPTRWKTEAFYGNPLTGFPPPQ